MGIVISNTSFEDAIMTAKMKGEEVTGQTINKQGKYIVFTKDKVSEMI
jgi:hypothetical protein